MSSPLRDRVSGPVVISGAVIALAGLGLFLVFAINHHGTVAIALLIVAMVVGGLALEVSGMVLHDRRHLQRGETPHAVWGTNDARRPERLGGPRR